MAKQDVVSLILIVAYLVFVGGLAILFAMGLATLYLWVLEKLESRR